MGQHFKSEGPPKPPPKHDIPQRSNETLVAKDLSILFVMLVHGNPDFVKRMIFALNESQHHFVIHVDKKSDETYESLKEFAIGVPNIYLLEYSKRVSGNWGGFTLVEATLNGF